LTRIANTTEFNTMKLLDGNFAGKFHIGANSGQNIELSIGDMSAEALKVVATSAAWFADAGTTDFDATDSTNNSGIDNLVTGAYKVIVSDDGSVSLRDEAGNEIGTGTGNAGESTIKVTVSNTSYLVDNTNTTITLAIAVGNDGSGNAVTKPGTISLYVLGKGQGISVMNQSDADNAITTINNAIERVSAERAKLGAYQNRLEHTIANLGTSAENLQAAESRIRDVDMAAEMMTFTKYQILQQASTAMLAQANLAPQSVLQLLG